jgi:23S rRNA (uracil1939-C5)-methyltransferase
MPELEIGWLLPDGRAGGRTADGSVVALDRGVPGDRVQWTPLGKSGKVVAGRVDAVVQPSPDRRAAPCPWTDRCGGCDLAEFAPDARRLALAHGVQRAFAAAARPIVVPSPRATGHRARIKLAIAGAAIGYRAARSHQIVPIDHCLVARPEIDDALQGLRALLAAGPLPGIAAVELRSDGARVALSFTSDGAVPAPTRAAIAGLGAVALDGRAIAGDPTLSIPVGERRLRASPLSFYQVNLEANAELVGFATQALLTRRPERLLDLYAGIGNFGVPIAQAGVPVVAVEAEGQATADLRHNAAGLPVEVIDARLPAWDATRTAFDALILDPPRSGAPGVLRRLLAQRPRVVVYVACDPAAGGRDVREAIAAGYRLADLRCFDLFPDTHHVETVAVLERARR